MLSPIIFGSMRLHEKPLTDADWQRLLDVSYARGVTSIHSSCEYESFPRLCELLKRRSSSDLSHMVKLAEPHFGDTGFSRIRLVEKIDAYLSALGCERLAAVQWMWRGELKQEDTRLRGLRDEAQEIQRAFQDLQLAGKVGKVLPFPYTETFATQAQALGIFDGLTMYLNPEEKDALPHFEALSQRDQVGVAIRPFFAGKALEQRSARACIEWVKGQPGVSCIVVSYSTLEQLDDIVGESPSSSRVA